MGGGSLLLILVHSEEKGMFCFSLPKGFRCSGSETCQERRAYGLCSVRLEASLAKKPMPQIAGKVGCAR
jgi:hypothetical protein